MSNMKCPFCGDEMKLTSLYMDGNHRYSHKYIGGLNGGKYRCPFDGETLPLRALQEIHHMHKMFEVAKNTMIHTDWFFDGDYNVDAKTMHNEIRCALKGITVLEQRKTVVKHNKIKFPEYKDGLLEEFDKQFFESGQDDDLTETALVQKDV